MSSLVRNYTTTSRDLISATCLWGGGVDCSLVNKNTLLYYRTEQDANNHPRGQIELSAAITVEVCASLPPAPPVPLAASPRRVL
jgi:hypothetical protein